jgi:DnaD/phage-associated family protein
VFETPGGWVVTDFVKSQEALTPLIADALLDAAATDNPAWACAAIDEAVKNNIRSWKYCQAILRRWRRDGFRVDKESGEKGSREAGGGKLLASNNAEVIRQVAAR